MNTKRVLFKDLTSFHIGGEADIAIISNEQDVQEVYEYATSNNLRVHILGGGTNTVFREDLSNVLIAKMEIKGQIADNRQQTTENGNDVFLTVMAGEDWDGVVKYAVENNWWGLENLSYIPGTVGGAPIQNIGAYGVELKDTLVSVRAFDSIQNEFVDITSVGCQFEYRNSLFKKEKNRYCIVSITLRLSKNKNPTLTYKPLDILKDKKDISIHDIRNEVIRIRKEKIPNYKNYPNAGSFFKNPILSQEEGEIFCKQHPDFPVRKSESGYKLSAAWLIEHVANMKGARKGDVGTWPAQPLVVVNYGEATCKELDDFTNQIIHIVQNNTGVILEREVNFVE